MNIKLLKRNISTNTIWVDTTGTGCAVADFLEAAGIEINRFTRHDQQQLQQHLNCGKHEIQKQKIPNELHQ